MARLVGLDVPVAEHRRDDRVADIPEAAEHPLDELVLVDGVAERVAEGGVEEALVDGPPPSIVLPVPVPYVLNASCVQPFAAPATAV